jgi:hypothetical protein
MYRKLCNRIFGDEIERFGFNDIVRSYSGYPKALPLPFNIYHGWYIEKPRPYDLTTPRSLLLVFNKRQAEEWRVCSDKPVAVLGAPFIHYRRRMNIQQNPDAAGTIVYPGHAATSIVSDFDIRKFCEVLVSLDPKFHPITVSVFENEIRDGLDSIYREYGFRTFTPGSPKSIEFCRNFYSELAKHRYSCGNHYGTNILYAVEMGIPYFFVGELCSGVLRTTGEKVVKDRTPEHLQLLERIRTLFAEPVDEVTPEQSEFIIAESGVDDCMPPDELRRLMLRMFFAREVPSAMVRAVNWPFRRLGGSAASKNGRGGARRLLSSCMAKAQAGYGHFARLLPPTRQEIVKLAPNDRATFFGYYDKTPFNLADDRVLGMNLREKDGRSADVGYFDLAQGSRFEILGETTTWSWQLGARLQWLPTRANEIVGYNKTVGSRHGFVLQNVRSKKIEAEYRDPVFDISSDGRYALGLNFARLHRMRAGYGYDGMEDPTRGRLCPDDDGVVLLDLKNNTRKLLVSLEALRALRPQESMEGAEHYVNHLAFSPSGDRFLFLHLWNRGKERFSRPITADIHGNDLFVLEEEVNMSHYAWKSDRELLIHTSKRPNGTKYILFQDRTAEKRVIGAKVLTEAGHPSYSPDGSRLVVDTYPDRTRRQSLLLCTSEGELVRELGRFYSPRAFSGSRKCDLHPRWDRGGKRICIDSAHEGQRAMYVINLNRSA